MPRDDPCQALDAANHRLVVARVSTCLDVIVQALMTMPRLAYAQRLMPLAAAWLLLGCQTPEAPESAGSAAAPETPADQPLGKPSAPVELSYRFLSEPRLGQPLEIEITASALRPDQSVALELSADTGLQLASQARLAPRILPLGEPRRDRAVVTPLAEGRLFLNVFATITSNGARQLKSISIPIQIGPVAEQQVAPELDADGTPIRTMPAEETTDN